MNNPLKYTDPSGYNHKPNRPDWRDGFYQLPWPHTIGSGPIGPGSGNHWSDQYMSLHEQFMFGNQAYFDQRNGAGAYMTYAGNYTGDNTRYEWNSKAGNEVYRESGEGYVNIYYTGAWVKASPFTAHGFGGSVPLYGNANAATGRVGDKEGQAGGGDLIQTVNDVSNYMGIVLSAAQQTIQNTKVGSNVVYWLSGNTKVLNGITNTFKYTPFVGLGITVLTGTYLSTEINPKTGQPYQSWVETGTDIGVNIATIYLAAQYGGWYGAGAAVFYLGVKTNVQYQIKNDLNPGMIFIMNKE
jgi:hypothetical protein